MKKYLSLMMLILVACNGGEDAPIDASATPELGDAEGELELNDSNALKSFVEDIDMANAKSFVIASEDGAASPVSKGSK